MIHNSFMPHPITTGLPLHTQWFTQDGAKHASQTYFWTSYMTPWMWNNWPPNTSGINPYDSFFLVTIKKSYSQENQH